MRCTFPGMNAACSGGRTKLPENLLSSKDLIAYAIVACVHKLVVLGTRCIHSCMHNWHAFGGTTIGLRLTTLPPRWGYAHQTIFESKTIQMQDKHLAQLCTIILRMACTIHVQFFTIIAQVDCPIIKQADCTINRQADCTIFALVAGRLCQGNYRQWRILFFERYCYSYCGHNELLIGTSF